MIEDLELTSLLAPVDQMLLFFASPREEQRRLLQDSSEGALFFDDGVYTTPIADSHLLLLVALEFTREVSRTVRQLVEIEEARPLAANDADLLELLEDLRVLFSCYLLEHTNDQIFDLSKTEEHDDHRVWRLVRSCCREALRLSRVQGLVSEAYFKALIQRYRVDLEN